MKLAILRNSDVMKKRIPDSDSATQNCMETSGFVSKQKVEFILLTCVIVKLPSWQTRNSKNAFFRCFATKTNFRGRRFGRECHFIRVNISKNR